MQMRIFQSFQCTTMVMSFQMQTSMDEKEMEELFVFHVEFFRIAPRHGEADVYLTFIFREGKRQDVRRILLVAVFLIPLLRFCRSTEYDGKVVALAEDLFLDKQKRHVR